MKRDYYTRRRPRKSARAEHRHKIKVACIGIAIFVVFLILMVFA
jgi:hypothetical protein